MKAYTLAEVRSAKKQAMQVFASIAPVVGVGITRIDDGYGLKVNLQRQPRPGVEVPTEVEGVPVRVEVVGTIKKQAVR